MKLCVNFGSKETHRIEVYVSAVSGKMTVVIDGIEIASSNWKRLTPDRHFEYDYPGCRVETVVGESEKYHVQVFPGSRPGWTRILIDGTPISPIITGRLRDGIVVVGGSILIVVLLVLLMIFLKSHRLDRL